MLTTMTRLLLVPISLSLLFAGVIAGKDVPSALKCILNIPNLNVLNTSSTGFTSAKAPFNLRIPTTPDIIVTPSSALQVSEIVQCAANSSLSVSAKSGGHSYAAYGLAGDVVVDLNKLKSITVDNHTGIAAIETGNRLGDVATTLFEHGHRVLPHGSCPYVGSGGHTLYGGFGYFSRVGGLLLDRAISADVVLANGKRVTASNTSNTDIFWAIRGGGPSFGIVTSWKFETIDAPSVVVDYKINYTSIALDQAVDAYFAWQAFSNNKDLPKELATAAVFSTVKGSGTRRDVLSLQFQGDYYGSQEKFDNIIDPLMKALPHGAIITRKPLDWIGGLEALGGGSLSTVQPDTPDTFFAKSLITTSPSSKEAITKWIKYLFENGTSSDTDWFAQVDLYGGKISEVATDATAFAHRDAFLVYQLYASSSNHKPPYPADGISFVNGMVTSLEEHPQGAYPNYIDPTLSDPTSNHQEWPKLYFGGHVQRLEKIKKDVDPNNVFRFAEGFDTKP